MRKLPLLAAPLVLTAGFEASALAQEAERLLAPVYPGAVALPGENYGEAKVPGMWRAFLSKDPIEKVTAFYEARLGPLEPVSFGDRLHPDPEGESRRSDVVSRIIMSASEVESIVHWGEFGAPPAGIEIGKKSPQAIPKPDDYPIVGDFFAKLLESTMMPGGPDRAEFEAVVERYKDLAWRFYPPSEVESDRGRLSMDEAIFRRCRERADGVGKEVDVGKQVQDLVMQGRMKEAQKLMEAQIEETNKLSEGMGAMVAEVWLDCLAELKPHAYRTMILINRHPSLWENR